MTEMMKIRKIAYEICIRINNNNAQQIKALGFSITFTWGPRSKY